METFKLPYSGDDTDRHFDNLPIPKPQFRSLIVGPSGCGKTYFLLSTFLLNPKFYYKNGKTYWQGGIYVFSPIALGEPLFKNLLLPEIKDKVYLSDTLDTNLLTEILNNHKDKKPKLIILDDFASYLKGGSNEKILNDVAFRSRHVNASCIILSQNYKSVPKPVRLNCTDLFLFNFQNLKELRLIEDEIGNKSLNGQQFIDTVQQVTRDKFCFIYKNKSGQFLNSNFQIIV